MKLDREWGSQDLTLPSSKRDCLGYTDLLQAATKSFVLLSFCLLS